MTATPYLANTPRDLDHVAAGGDSVAVWSLETHRRVASFSPPAPVVLGRLAAGRWHDERVVVCAGLDRGVAAYRAVSGELLWYRKELPAVQQAACVEDHAVALSFLRTPAVSVDLWTGETIATGLRWLAVHSDVVKGKALAGFDGYAAIVEPWTGKRRIRIPGVTLGITASAVAGERILIAGWDVGQEGAPGFVREIALDGTTIWEQPNPRAVSVLALGFDARDGSWVGLEQDVEHRSPDVLVRWDAGGAVVARLRTPWTCMDGKVVGSGRLLAMTHVRRREILLLDTKSGERVASLV